MSNLLNPNNLSFLSVVCNFCHVFWSKSIIMTFGMLQYIVTSELSLLQTLLNQRTSSRDSPLYLASILPAYVMTVIMGVLAYYIAGGSLANVRSCFPCGNARKYEIDWVLWELISLHLALKLLSLYFVIFKFFSVILFFYFWMSFSENKIVVVMFVMQFFSV